MGLSIAFSPDGSHLAVGNPRGIVYLWKVFSTAQSLIDHACATLARDFSNEERRKFSLDFANRGKEYDGFLVPGQRPQRCRAKGES
jgi:WD40 repeat protein